MQFINVRCRPCNKHFEKHLTLLRLINKHYKRVFFRTMGLIQKIKMLVVAMETCRQFAYPASDFVQQPGFVNIYPKLQASGAARGIVNWVRPHIVLATRQHDTHSIDASYVGSGALCNRVLLFIVIGDTLGVSKDATTRVVYCESKALCAMGLLGRGLVIFPTSAARKFLQCCCHL